jgi:hypothetical protein
MSKDGGQAFPIAYSYHNEREGFDEVVREEGMTLRDYFAAKAMQGMLCNGFRPDQCHVADVWDYSAAAYLLADQMLKARES